MWRVEMEYMFMEYSLGDPVPGTGMLSLTGEFSEVWFIMSQLLDMLKPNETFNQFYVYEEKQHDRTRYH